MYTAIKLLTLPLLCVLLLVFLYPIDGYDRTGIKRLKRLELIQSGEIKTTSPLPSGALRSWNDINLHLTTLNKDSLSAFFKEDAQLQKEISGLFRGLDKSYSLSIVDISDPANVRYAHRNETLGYQPGSVGKLAVLVAIFTQLEKIYPDSWENRMELLKNKSVKSGVWGLTDEHTVPIYNIEKNTLVKRQVIASDVFTLYEWVDHMLSVSNNGAASIVWREALLMAAFGNSVSGINRGTGISLF